MDSAGNEVIIVDDRAQTNGFNGNYSSEEVSEMKTRSKAIASGGPGEAAKLRSSSRTNATAGGATVASSVSNSHNKNDVAAATATPAAPASIIGTSGSAAAAAALEKDKKMNLRSGVADPQADSAPTAGGKLASAGDAGGKKNAAEGTPAAGPKSSKKGAGSVVGVDREDDSGINSRSSSVSTDDTYSSRLRTRSKRTEAALSSSTPASTRKAATRMPLSTYDFDDDSIILEEDASSSLKRKATKILVEEMDDEEIAATAQDDDEPPVKVTVIQRTSFFNVLLNPLKAIRGRIFVGSQSQLQDKLPEGATDDATIGSKTNDEGPKIIIDSAASQSDHHIEAEATTATQEDGKEATSTCMVM